MNEKHTEVGGIGMIREGRGVIVYFTYRACILFGGLGLVLTIYMLRTMA